MHRHYRALGLADDAAHQLAAKFSGHSGRVGFIVSAREAGAADLSIAQATRHRGTKMIVRYGEQASQLSTSPHRLKTVGV